jgi:hypothetical protein
MSIEDDKGANHRIPAERDWPLFRYIQWRMAHDRDPRLVAFEDKLALKALARDAGVPTVPTLAMIDLDDLDLDGHPALQLGRFVIKSNHGWNDIVLVERLAPGRFGLSGAHLNGQFGTRDATAEIRRHFRWWIDCFESRDEWAVDQIARRQIFAEPWLPLTDDYKVQVVGGRAIWVDALSGRFEANGVYGGTFDRDWRMLCPVRSARLMADPWGTVRARFPRPDGLATLLAQAEAVAPADMCLVRVDFFLQPDGSFVLGEAAVYTNGGRPTHAPGAEVALGRLAYDELSARGFIAAAPAAARPRRRGRGGAG